MRKPAFGIGENKDADQLRGNNEAHIISTHQSCDAGVAMLMDTQNIGF